MTAKEVLGKVWDEFKRPAVQGAAELANAMFNGNAFVPYGEGQQETQQASQEVQNEQKPPEPQQDMGMER